MPDSKILHKLAKKQLKPEQAANKVAKNFKLLDEIVEGFFSDKARVKFGCGKILQILSEKYPKKVYPKWDQIVKQLDSENNILKWNALTTLGNLTAADKEKKFEKIFNKYYSHLKGIKLVPAAIVVGRSPIIVKAKPKLESKITKLLLGTEKAKLETTECRNVLLGHAITAFGEYFEQIKDKEKVIEFVKKQLKNTRNGTAKKAEKFLRKYEK